MNLYSYKDRRHEVLKGVPTSTSTLLYVDLTRADPTWPHVDPDPPRPDMNYYILFTPKKTEHDVKIVKIVNVFKKIRTIAIFMRKDVPNPGKLVW